MYRCLGIPSMQLTAIYSSHRRVIVKMQNNILMVVFEVIVRSSSLCI